MVDAIDRVLVPVIIEDALELPVLADVATVVLRVVVMGQIAKEDIVVASPEFLDQMVAYRPQAAGNKNLHESFSDEVGGLEFLRKKNDVPSETGRDSRKKVLQRNEGSSCPRHALEKSVEHDVAPWAIEMGNSAYFTGSVAVAFEELP